MESLGGTDSETGGPNLDTETTSAPSEDSGTDEGTTDTGETEGDSTTGDPPPPEDPLFELGFSPIKQFDFTWTQFDGAVFYQLFESLGGEPYVQVGADMMDLTASLTVPLHFRLNASYRLRACNDGGCTDSDPLNVSGTMVEAIGYFKASNTDAGDYLGYDVALSNDGTTMVVGAPREDGAAKGVGGNETSNTAPDAGAVYVYVRDGENDWSQQAYIKASNTDAGDEFGGSVTLSADGNLLAVGARLEDSESVGVQNHSGMDWAGQANNSGPDAGAVYVFVRNGDGTWMQEAYLKASNAEVGDNFGTSVALSSDGATLAVGSVYEDSGAPGIGGDQTDNTITDAGAVYVFVRDGQGTWSQQAYAKASNPDKADCFGHHMGISADGHTLAVGAIYEDSSATGIGGEQLDNSVSDSGAVYVLVRDKANGWSQQAYVKAFDSDPGDNFSGGGVAVSGDGNTVVVGSALEDSGAPGVGGDPFDDSAMDAGAVHVFVRDGQDTWSQQTYIKASNAQPGDLFGYGIALSDEGTTLVVGAIEEDGDARGVGGDQGDDSMDGAGAAYVFVRSEENTWSQRAYVKASNPDVLDRFGYRMALSDDGGMMVITSFMEASGATGIGGEAEDNSAIDAGAVYVY